jgi:hypothetical protein
MAFATAADVEARLGRDLTDDETARMAVLLEDATDLIRSVTGQVLYPAGSETVRLEATNRVVYYFPQAPVTAVASVVDSDGLTVTADYTWTADGRLWRSLSWGRRRGDVTVTYSYGYATVPDPLVRLCSRLAVSMLTQPVGAAVKSESIGSYSVTYGDGSTLFSDEDLRTLAPFTRTFGP